MFKFRDNAQPAPRSSRYNPHYALRRHRPVDEPGGRLFRVATPGVAGGGPLALAPAGERPPPGRAPAVRALRLQPDGQHERRLPRVRDEHFSMTPTLTAGAPVSVVGCSSGLHA